MLSGYAGETLKKPTYEQVCSETTGHAEVVQVQFDPAVVSYEDLFRKFFRAHDPTTLNRQGADSGKFLSVDHSVPRCESEGDRRKSEG